MICPECKKQGLKSKVYQWGTSSTLLYWQPFYDEDGKLHCHNRNTIMTDYDCSNGHHWVDKSIGSCWCGWSDDEEMR